MYKKNCNLRFKTLIENLYGVVCNSEYDRLNEKLYLIILWVCNAVFQFRNPNLSILTTAQKQKLGPATHITCHILVPIGLFTFFIIRLLHNKNVTQLTRVCICGNNSNSLVCISRVDQNLIISLTRQSLQIYYLVFTNYNASSTICLLTSSLSSTSMASSSFS